MALSQVSIAPASISGGGEASLRVKHLLAEVKKDDPKDVHAAIQELVSQYAGQVDSPNLATNAILQSLVEAQQNERVIAELSNLVPVCGEATKLTRWWRQCVRYLTMFELVLVPEGSELDLDRFVLRCSERLQQQVGTLLFQRLDDEARHCVEIFISNTPGVTFAFTHIGKAVIAAIQSNSRPAPLEQLVTEDKANGNMWFIMDSWDAPAKVMRINDPIATTQNFLAVYERYLQDPALLFVYVQVLRECSVAAANCLLQDKFMESDMLRVTNVGEYINDTILPLLRVTKPRWDVDADADADANDSEGEDAPKEAVRNLHWSRAKRCFGCGSAEHALNNCTTLPPDCNKETLEEIRANAVVPAGYKWRTAKTVLKMHKYSPVLRNRQDTSSEMEDTFLSGI